METAVRRRLGRETLAGVRVALVGLGTVGFRLAELLRTAGVRLTVADRDPRRTERAVRELGVKCVTVEEIVHLDADVLSPCASKDFIDDGTLCHLRCQIVAGSADDPLKTPAHGHALHDRGILYAPDCVIAAGGLIALAQPFLSAEAAATPLARQLQGIGRRLDALVDQALRENQPIAVIAERVVETAFGARLGAGISSALAG
jgi:leucine dehydrogenase